MKKSDLRDGMICETGDHELGMVLGDRIVFQDCVLVLDYINENLYYKYNKHNIYESCSVIAVYKVVGVSGVDDIFNRCNLETLWKREEVKKVMWSEVPEELKNQLENYIVEES